DGRPGFLLAAVERIALLFSLTALARELLAFLREPRRLFRCVLLLRVEADHGLLLLMVLGVERGDRVRRMGDRTFQLRRLLCEADERVAIRGDPLAQFLDLALRFED